MKVGCLLGEKKKRGETMGAFKEEKEKIVQEN